MNVIYKIKKNKKGFTLVELIVGTAILAVVGLTVAMMMTAGTNIYRGVHKRSTVLFRSQVSSIQLQEILAVNKCPFAVDGSDLLIGVVERNPAVENAYVLYIDAYKFDAESKEIELVRYAVNGQSGNGGNPGGYSLGEQTQSVRFSKDITSVNYNVFRSGDTAGAVKFEIGVKKFGLNYIRNEVVSLRNKPIYVSASASDNAGNPDDGPDEASQSDGSQSEGADIYNELAQRLGKYAETL